MDTSQPSLATITVDFGRIVKEVITEIGVSDAASNDLNAPIFRTPALWDTGATRSAITRRTIDALGLEWVDNDILFHAGGWSESKVYFATIHLSPLARIDVQAIETSDAFGDYGIIIGMDIISMGDFEITNASGTTTFSFCMPASRRVDFREEER